MPQAPSHLQAMFADDRAAWDVLATDYADHAGMIRNLVPGYEPTDHQGDAIDYLVMEWDYGYEPRK